MTDAKQREQICLLAKSMFDRGLTAGASGNISVRCADGSLLVTPTGACFGRLDPGQLSHISAAGQHLSGDAPTKEMPLHSAFMRAARILARSCICIPPIRWRCR